MARPVDWGRMTEDEAYAEVVAGLQCLRFEKVVEALFAAVGKDELLELSEIIDDRIA